MGDRPLLTKEQIKALEAYYPPRCFEPSRESLEQHMKYAGKIELIALLRADTESASRSLVGLEALQTWEQN